ncbi:hypothetical protein TRAPUB_6408 [Trametes pubescens]|uniref:Uncharacterized protein n=1 Tax=Trametes pubescens TaxID=154538 RepID=A0A1M2V651_TRAPU|nr:hypothetical protein TRAPUB_6408 [Trametes pubescens]
MTVRHGDPERPFGACKSGLLGHRILVRGAQESPSASKAVRSKLRSIQFDTLGRTGGLVTNPTRTGRRDWRDAALVRPG